jgi:bifunctional non-homologous end joining protein LigD
MSDRLARYRQLRDFAATPEPAGDAPPPLPEGPARFVIQQHDATRLHWDLRLEHDGVLVSFALPRGLPWSPGENRLAVHTEDHPLEYLDFHGEIPRGEYGAGRMTVWDRGRYEARTFTDDKVVVVLHGQRVEGTYALFPLRDRDWMIHRMDPPQDPARQPLPTDLRPMRAVGAGMPDAPDEWAFEIDWVGARALVANDAGRIAITGGDGGDLTDQFPEVRRLGRALGAVEVVLDCVIVAVDRDGRPRVDAEQIGRRLAADSDSVRRRLARDQPVAAIAFDLLWLEGHPATSLPYDDRRTLLLEMELQGPAWQAPRHHIGDGAPLLAAAQAQGLPGLIAKRRSSPYEPGGVTEDWRVIR